VAALFEDPDGDSLSFSASLDQPDLGDLTWNGTILQVQGLGQGEVRLRLSADDGQNLPALLEVPILIYPPAHDLSLQSYLFDQWDADQPERTYPPHMLFLQSDRNDPGLEDTLRHAYHIPHADYAAGDAGNIGFPYRNESRTRLNGLGEQGISFINTGRGRDLGAALLNVNTQELDTVLVRWTAGTLRPNSRVYHLRLQYRPGLDGAWTDVTDASGEPLEYRRSDQEGHEQSFDWLALPEEALGQPNLLLQWKYHFTGEQLDPGSGARDMLRLDDVEVMRERPSTTGSVASEGPLRMFPNPVVAGMVFFNRVTSGALFDITGRMVAKMIDTSRLDVTHLPAGFYVYRDLLGEVLPLVVP
jgi:hypothetical protein